MVHPFKVGKRYTRKDVYHIIKVPESKREGNWNTGYNRYKDDVFIFANVGSPGRTGHDYNNRWEKGGLVWYGKNGSNLRHESIQYMLNPSGSVYLFTREDQRAMFIFQGTVSPVSMEDTIPVLIKWKVDL